MPRWLIDLTLLAGSGALGTLARFGVIQLVRKLLLPGNWPWGVLAANALGAFLAGFLWMVLETKTEWRYHGGLLILTGFLGAFTTFSSIMLESGKMVRDGDWHSAVWHIVIQNLIGLGAALLGIWLGKGIYHG